MRDAQPKTIYLSDYQVPDFLIDHTDLQFRLGEDVTEVTSRLTLRRNPDSTNHKAALVLHGENMQLYSLAVDGVVLTEEDYQLSDETLRIEKLPDVFTLACVTLIQPQLNTSLEGLYRSQTMYCTQCEAEGFRKITYYLDRPDVMSLFTTTIIADKKQYPVLLSNGNLVDSGDNGDGSHWVCWKDPFKKPAYLFALVAGDLSCIEDSFQTLSGQEVALRIFVEEKDIDKCDHAMASLKASMKWDEEVFGREYDLNIFNIVAVDDFNMGAMENKSLNIFNTSCVLASPKTTTDAGFQRVEAVVAHEYFHNWSGNRVTCRDWFQLSLKEGFTVYRDAEFSSDMGSRTVKRVEEVNLLRTVQFAEDAGPMAHPIRPDSFMEISNFYTVTIYEKGAEVVRMLANILGPEFFRKATDLYFDRHDGQAVTCEDFVKAMEDASGIDLTQFRRWYSQAGTPRLEVSDHYNAEDKSYHLTVKQHAPITVIQQQVKPFHIPLAISLYGDAGAYALQLRGEAVNAEMEDNTERVLNITEPEQTFVFEAIQEPPTPSLLRGFSAPVYLDYSYTRDQLLYLMTNDSDGYCRWDAAQQLGLSILTEGIKAYQSGQALTLDTHLELGFKALMANDQLDKSMVAMLLQLPSEAYVAGVSSKADAVAIHHVRRSIQVRLAKALYDDFLSLYHANVIEEPYSADAQQIACRALKNTALHYLMLAETEEALSLTVKQFANANNMTDQFSALTCLVHSFYEEQKQQALASFYQQWQHEALVVNQWFMVQATAPVDNALEQVQALMQHPAFDIKNPNKVRALIAAFAGQNAVNFHRKDGAGYVFLAEQIKVLNGFNPQIASRLLTPLTKWRQYCEPSASLMKQALEAIREEASLSKDVYEVVEKSLA